MRIRPLHCLGILAVMLTAAADRGQADEPTAEQARFFETHVRPLLAESCLKCHGEEKQKGGLRLDSLASLLAGGESGPAIVPGKPEESLLVEAINYASFEMPPTGKLPDEQIALLTRWIEMGAPWPGADPTAPVRTADQPRITDEDRQWWAYQPVRDHAPPQLDGDNWSRNDVDRFVLERLRDAGLSPAPEADKRTLIRRVTFDLTGLPPTPEEIEAFLADDTPSAYERLVDRLLDSPRYGEKWARHWLDLVRYAESDGYKQDAYRPNAWRYRDYVIRSFNNDKPYDRFLTEQLAGDEVAPDDPDALIATGYLRHWIYEYNQRDVRTQWDTILNDVTDTTADVFLGMGMGCARCHDHKFDPILQEDYFRLRAFFAPLLPRDDIPAATPEQRAEYAAKLAAWEEKAGDLLAQIDAIKAPYREKRAEPAINKFPPDIRPMLREIAAERGPYETQIAELAYRQILAEYNSIKLSKEDQAKVDALEEQFRQFQADKPAPLPEADTVTDVGPAAPPTLIPGDRQQRDIPPGFLTILHPEPATIEPVPSAPNSTGRRTALARWLTDPENPLSTRVIVNRVWQYHFGTGLVATASDFGRLGEPPSHPELLDWLTCRFLESGWRLKPLHRMIVLSATYRQSSAVEMPNAESGQPAEGASSSAFRSPLSIDPENRLLWHANIRRLDAEQIRDAMLAVAGELDLTAGGPSVDAAKPRRSVYTKVTRNVKDPLLDAFDVAEGFTSTPRRNTTTTPTQALLLINGDWPLQRAKTLASQLRDRSDADAVTEAYRRVYGRAPTDDERAAAVAFLSAQASRIAPGQTQSAEIATAAMPHTGGESVRLEPRDRRQRIVLPTGTPVPTGDYTIEAVFLLESLYDDATVRTIASCWDGNNSHPGWSFGVTSTKSRYEPRNLILQLVGDDASGQRTYEVIPSGLRPELNRPYYAAVAVNLADTTPAGITFYLFDLSDQDAVLQSTQVAHTVVSQSGTRSPFILGDRDGGPSSAWDGIIDELRFSDRPLTRDQLLVNRGASDSLFAHWRFEDKTNLLADSGPRKLDLQTGNLSVHDARTAALTDLCHVLLNSNEFLYVD